MNTFPFATSNYAQKARKGSFIMPNAMSKKKQKTAPITTKENFSSQNSDKYILFSDIASPLQGFCRFRVWEISIKNGQHQS